MKKTALAILLMSSAFGCIALQIANAPILFKGMDEVPITSICSSGSIFFKDGIDGNKGMCTPSIDEYAGEEIIQRSKDSRESHLSYMEYSYVEYDLESKKVMSLNFVMRYGAIDRLREILESKYGKAQKDPRVPRIRYWYGDKNGNAFMYLEEWEPKSSFLGSPATEGQTNLVIVTAAMAKVQDAVEARVLRSSRENKAKAIKGL
jgi:hypothetical protein